MSVPDRTDAADVPSDALPDAFTLIAALRAAGADRFDPVRLRYIEALAERAADYQGSAKRLLDAKLTQAVTALKVRFEAAQHEARDAVTRNAQQYPHAAKDLEQLLAAGDFKGVRRLLSTLKTNEQCASLGALVRQLDQQSPENGQAVEAGGAIAGGSTGGRTELKAIRKFRDTWSKLSIDRQVTQALEQAPKNAGPINSHMLVLRSLLLMRDISPDYLNRFISYADTLLALDPGEKEKPVSPKKTAAKTAKK